MKITVKHLPRKPRFKTSAPIRTANKSFTQIMTLHRFTMVVMASHSLRIITLSIAKDCKARSHVGVIVGRETPLPIYMGAYIACKDRDTLFSLGLSISYDRFYSNEQSCVRAVHV